MDKNDKKTVSVKGLEIKRQKYAIPAFRDMFGERLKALRKEKNLTQQDVADKVEVAVSTYANWEQGRREPSIFDIYGLLQAFDIDANELFDISDIY